MSQAVRISTSSDEREPNQPRLRLAPDELRCQFVIEGDRKGAQSQCSRFTIKNTKATGGREKYCVSHSRSETAKECRARASRALEAAAEAERDRLASVAWEILPQDWRHCRDFQETRFRIFHSLVRGDVTTGQAKVLQSIVRDAERHAQVPVHAWSHEYRQ
jgi:hypothetical protein